MKRLINGVWLLLILGCLSSCHNDPEPQMSGNLRGNGGKGKSIKKTVRMSLGGDYVSESEEPLLRADGGETFVGINVFRTKKDVTNAVEEKYAYGLFMAGGNIDIDVYTGYTYRFESGIVVEDKDNLFLNNNSYNQPFQINYQQNITGTPSGYHKTYLDRFRYSASELDPDGNIVADNKRNYFHQLASGAADIIGGSDMETRYGVVWYPLVKRYYGTFSSFDPEVSESVNIEMDYRSFGLKFEIAGLPGGYVTVKDVTRVDALREKSKEQLLRFPKDLRLSKENTEWSGIYSMYNLLADSETFNLEFTWHKGVDAKETFTTSVTVRPNTKKVLRLNINGNPTYETKGNISFTLASEVLKEEVQQTDRTFD